MKPPNSTVRLSPDLKAAACLRAELLGYETFSQYLIGLVRLDAINDLDHDKPLRIKELAGRKRDAIDAKILESIEQAAVQWRVVEDKEIDGLTSNLRTRDRDAVPT